jgi:DNA repair protein RecO (recombination protein O)
MQWTDEGVILATRRHGETSLIVELMTLAHGRHLGLVRGGRSPRVQPVLQPGNSVLATWRARLDEHLGNYAVEATALRAARLMEGAAGLYGLQMVAGLVRLLPERDPHPDLYEGVIALLDLLDDPSVAGRLLVRFEARMLEELGFGLDLECCAATGTTAELVYVSPRTGRAVSRAAGEPYNDRLLALPRFMVEFGVAEPPPAEDIRAGFRLTGYFLARHVYEPRGFAPPDARARFIALLGDGAVREGA